MGTKTGEREKKKEKKRGRVQVRIAHWMCRIVIKHCVKLIWRMASKWYTFSPAHRDFGIVLFSVPGGFLYRSVFYTGRFLCLVLSPEQWKRLSTESRHTKITAEKCDSLLSSLYKGGFVNDESETVTAIRLQVATRKWLELTLCGSESTLLALCRFSLLRKKPSLSVTGSKVNVTSRA